MPNQTSVDDFTMTPQNVAQPSAPAETDPELPARSPPAPLTRGGRALAPAEGASEGTLDPGDDDSEGSGSRAINAVPRGVSRLLSWLTDDWLAGDNAWILLLTLGAVLRASQILFYIGPMDHVFSDPARHLDNARNFLQPGPMGCSNPYFYQLFLFAVVTVTKEERLGMHLVSAGLCVVYPYVWYRFARTVMTRRVQALRFAAVLTFLPTHAIMYQYFMNETVLLPLLGASLWASSVAARRRSAPLFLLATGLWTCTILTRSIAFPLAFAVLGYCLFHQVHKKLHALLWRPILALAAAAITAAGLWIAAQHSLRILEYATPFGDNTTVPLYMVSGAKVYETTYMKPGRFSYTYSFSSPSFYVSPFYPFYDWHSVRTETFAYSTNVETKGQDLKKLYWKKLSENKRQLPQLIYENALFLAFGHAWPEAGTGSVQSLVCLHERWIWLPIMLAAAFGSVWFLYRRREPRLVPMLAILATATLFGLQLAVMEGRYRKPIEPIWVLTLFWLAEAWWPHAGLRRTLRATDMAS